MRLITELGRPEDGRDVFYRDKSSMVGLGRRQSFAIGRYRSKAALPPMNSGRQLRADAQLVISETAFCAGKVKAPLPDPCVRSD